MPAMPPIWWVCGRLWGGRKGERRRRRWVDTRGKIDTRIEEVNKGRVGGYHLRKIEFALEESGVDTWWRWISRRGVGEEMEDVG